MANDAARLLMDPKLRREMGKRARASAIERYRLLHDDHSAVH